MNTPPGPHAGAEQRLFGDTLSCELELPMAVLASDSRGRQAQAETLLVSLARLEDLRRDDGEDHGDPLLAQRIDAKLDLILALLGHLVHRSDAMPVRRVRWSRHGLQADFGQDQGLGTGDAVVLKLQPADWLPDHLELPAVVLEQAVIPGGQRLWLGFSDLRLGLSEAIDRHLFRLHRRQIAEQRRV